MHASLYNVFLSLFLVAPKRWSTSYGDRVNESEAFYPWLVQLLHNSLEIPGIRTRVIEYLWQCVRERIGYFIIIAC